jgi:hypothetical protein
MNWRFCPHCETELDAGTGICPACRWDPLDVPEAAAPEDHRSLMERYRGTEYDSRAASAMVAPRRGAGGIARGRVALIVGVLAIAALYGGMVAWMAVKDSVAAPAAPVGVTLER